MPLQKFRNFLSLMYSVLQNILKRCFTANFSPSAASKAIFFLPSASSTLLHQDFIMKNSLPKSPFFRRWKRWETHNLWSPDRCPNTRRWPQRISKPSPCKTVSTRKEVYEHMVADSLSTCDQLQHQLDDLIMDLHQGHHVNIPSANLQPTVKTVSVVPSTLSCDRVLSWWLLLVFLVLFFVQYIKNGSDGWGHSSGGGGGKGPDSRSHRPLMNHNWC